MQAGQPITFTYKGQQVTYYTVYNPVTGRYWLDRNLGASRVATAPDDSDAYGDLFQWGRLDDGHQDRSSGVTTTKSTTDVPGHNNFITVPNESPWDWRDPQNDALWNSPNWTNLIQELVEKGFRVPTKEEWQSEVDSWSSQDPNGAFASPLKLTMAGYRAYNNGNIGNTGTKAFYWSSTVYNGVYGTSYRLIFSSSIIDISSYFRANGHSVRLIYYKSSTPRKTKSLTYKMKPSIKIGKDLVYKVFLEHVTTQAVDNIEKTTARAHGTVEEQIG